MFDPFTFIAATIVKGIVDSSLETQREEEARQARNQQLRNSLLSAAGTAVIGILSVAIKNAIEHKETKE